MTEAARIRVLQHRDRTPALWANGGGMTYEVIRSPIGGDAFDWRLSVAEVAAEGPFSSYPGVDRILLLLQGSMTLRIDDQAHDVAPFAPVSFPGEASVVSVLPSGPTMDLNVMTRRGRATADVEVLSHPDFELSPDQESDTFVFVADGTWRVAREDLAPWDCVVADGPIRLHGEGTLAVVRLRMRADSL